MSHLTSVKTQLKDLAAVRAAIGEMGFTLAGRGVVQGRAVDELVRVPGGRDMGLVAQADGTYTLVADWYYLTRTLGSQEAWVGRLQQLYGVHKALAEAAVQGYSVERETDPSGVIRLTLSRY